MRRFGYLGILFGLVLAPTPAVSGSETANPNILKILKADPETKDAENTGGLVVHGLDPSTTRVDEARTHIRSLGLYGRIAVDRLYLTTIDGKLLCLGGMRDK